MMKSVGVYHKNINETVLGKKGRMLIGCRCHLDKI